MHVIQRNLEKPHLTHLQTVHVTRGELFYLRSLLLSGPGISWEDLRIVEGTLHPSFQAACIALGLFADKNEDQVCMRETVTTFRTPQQLRILFVHLLTNSCMDTPLKFGTHSDTKSLRIVSTTLAVTSTTATTMLSNSSDHSSGDTKNVSTTTGCRSL